MALRSPLLACAATLALVLSGCGGGDDDGGGPPAPQPRPAAGDDGLAGAEVRPANRRERAIREAKDTTLLLVDATNDRQPSACSLGTLRWLEELTGRRGAAARQRCREVVRRSTGRLEVLDFTGSRYDGEAVVLTMTVQAGDQQRTYRVRLVRGRAPGRWLIDDRDP